jgi:twitching motility protein PilJ
MAQSGASLREVDYANQLAVLSQRIAKNANALALPTRSIPRSRSCCRKDSQTFRDVLAGLTKGSDTLRLPGVRGEDARSRWPSCNGASRATSRA